MSIAGGIVVYVILWWVIFFAALPFGVRPGSDTEAGQDAGAPVNPRLWTKAGVATVAAAILWVAAYFVIRSEWFTFGP